MVWWWARWLICIVTGADELVGLLMMLMNWAHTSRIAEMFMTSILLKLNWRIVYCMKRGIGWKNSYKQEAYALKILSCLFGIYEDYDWNGISLEYWMVVCSMTLVGLVVIQDNCVVNAGAHVVVDLACSMNRPWEEDGRVRVLRRSWVSMTIQYDNWWAMQD
jgi:hypothetical protein